MPNMFEGTTGEDPLRANQRDWLMRNTTGMEPREGPPVTSSPPSAAIDTGRPPERYDPTGQQQAAGVLQGQGRRPNAPMPRNYGETGGQPAIGRDTTGGPATLPDAPPIPDMSSQTAAWAPGDTGELPQTPFAEPAGRLGETRSYPPDKRATQYGPGTDTVTQAGKPGGGGGGASVGGGGGGRRKALGDQTRTEAYDPTKDRADPRNIAAVDENYGVNPKTWEDAQKGAIDPTKPGVRHGEEAAKFTNNYTASLAGATKYMEDMFHQKKGDPNQPEGYHAMTFKAVGAPDQATVNGVFQVVDPQNQLQPKEKMELATRAMHDWYTHRGNTQAADKVAAEMLQYGNKQAQAVGNQVLQAVKAGDRDGAAKLIEQAYSWLPDGYHAEVQGDRLVVHDGKGKTVNTIPLDDKQIANLGTGLATGTLYWDIVQNRAGKPGTFAPPTQQPAQPTQAIAAQPPAPGAVPSAPGGAPGAAPAAGVAAPGAAPAAGGPPPAPPGRAPMDERPNAGPTQAIDTPPSNRPAAPAPAAPGPAPTQQAAPIDQATGKPMEQGDGGPSGSPAGPGGPQQAAAIQTAPPEPWKTGQTPMLPQVMPGSDKPIAPTEPEKKPAEPAPSETRTPSTPSATKPAEPAKPAEETKPGEQKKITLVRPNDDPDAVPTHTSDGRPWEPHRDHSTGEGPMVTRAREAVAQADQQFELQKQVAIAAMARLNPKNKADAAGIAKIKQYEALAKDTRDRTVSRHTDVLRDAEKQRSEQDRQEVQNLKPQPLKGEDKTNAEAAVKSEFDRFIANKDKPGEKGTPNPYHNSPLRLDDEKTNTVKKEMSQIAIQLMQHNPGLEAEDAAKYVISMTMHVPDEKNDPNAKALSLNEATGAKGSRFQVWKKDLVGQPVIRVRDGEDVVSLHVPVKVLNSIQRFKRQSFEDDAKKVEEKGKATEAAALQTKLDKEAEAKGERTGLGAIVHPAFRQTEAQKKSNPMGAAEIEALGAFYNFTTPHLIEMAGRFGWDTLRKLQKNMQENKGTDQTVLPAPGT